MESLSTVDFLYQIFVFIINIKTNAGCSITQSAFGIRVHLSLHVLPGMELFTLWKQLSDAASTYQHLFTNLDKFFLQRSLSRVRTLFHVISAHPRVLFLSYARSRTPSVFFTGFMRPTNFVSLQCPPSLRNYLSVPYFLYSFLPDFIWATRGISRRNVDTSVETDQSWRNVAHMWWTHVTAKKPLTCVFSSN